MASPAIKVTSPKAQAAPGSLINRAHVAAAFDRGDAPDGVISREELAEAGITRIDAEAVRLINAPGEKGEAITVDELAKALGADQVVISSDGAIKIENKRATLVNGRLEPSAPWSFPEVSDLKLLETFHRLVPRMGRYNPDWPDGYYVDRVFKGYERVKVGTRRVEDGKNSDGTTRYRDEDVYEDRPKYEDEIQYDRLARDLRYKARDVLATYQGSEDPGVRAAYENLKAAEDRYGGFSFWGAESAARGLYRALNAIDDIRLPARPEVLVGRLDAALNETSGAIDEQFRIARDIPVARARQAIAAEVGRLKGPSAANFVAGGLALAAGAGVGFGFLGGLFTGAAVLAGLPLVGAAAGIGLVAGGIGWGIAQLVKNGKASGLEKDLVVLQGIDPQGNRKEMQQHALAAYRLLQDAREADFLAALRVFEADAAKVEAALKAVKANAEAQTRSLRTVERWVLKYKG